MVNVSWAGKLDTTLFPKFLIVMHLYSVFRMTCLTNHQIIMNLATPPTFPKKILHHLDTNAPSMTLTLIPKSASKFPISTCRSSMTRREFLVAHDTVFRSRWSRGGGGGRVSSFELSKYRRQTSLTRAVTACINRRAMYTGMRREKV